MEDGQRGKADRSSFGLNRDSIGTIRGFASVGTRSAETERQYEGSIPRAVRQSDGQWSRVNVQCSKQAFRYSDHTISSFGEMSWYHKWQIQVETRDLTITDRQACGGGCRD